MANFWSLFTVLTFLVLVRGIIVPNQLVLKENDIKITAGSNKKDAPPVYSTEPSLEGWRHKSKTLNFDDIDHGPDAKPMGNISTYENLEFSGFQVFDVDHSAYEGLISIDDINCATSPHNAILGSRATRSTWPRFVVENWNETSTYFKVRGLSIKPVGSIPLYLSILMTGWEVVDGYPVNSTFLAITYLRAGHMPVTHVDLTRFPSWDTKVNMVEAYASAPGGKDWPFCMDDIELDLFEKTSVDV